MHAAELGDAPGRSDAIGELGNERHPHVPPPWVHAVRLPGEILSRQHGNVGRRKKLSDERLVIARTALGCGGAPGPAACRVIVGGT